jgi:hypothetical protein
VAKDRSKKAYLAKLADAGFVPPDNWDIDGIARVEARRVRGNALMACVASETARRLGAEAESVNLAGDRYLSKGIANVYFTCWRRLTVAKNAPLLVEELGEEEQHLYPPQDWKALHRLAVLNDEATRAGRTVIWDRWWQELRPRLLARRTAIATFALRESQMSWGYRVVAGIGNEIQWINDKFEDFNLRYGFQEDDAA